MIEQHAFSGTRNGMTGNQMLKLDEFLKELRGTWHHGLCVGADAESHKLARNRGLLIAGHPPVHKKWMARGLRSDCDLVYLDEDYLVRNRIMVDLTSRLYAAPATFREMNKMGNGGTWWTINYARHIGRPLTIIFPDGSVKHEHTAPSQKAFLWA